MSIRAFERTVRLAVLMVFMAAGPASAQICTVDLNASGDVGTDDVLELFWLWGEGAGSPGDFNGDGLVDGFDLGYLLGHFGLLCPDGDLELPEPEGLPIVWADVTDPETAQAGLRELDVFAELPAADDVLLNVFDADLFCQTDVCFTKAFPTGALPVSEEVWKLLGLTYDSFVTIGPAFQQEGTETTLDPNFDEELFVSGQSLGVDGGWFAIPPPYGDQGVAGQYPDNQVRIATLTIPAGSAVVGDLSLMYRTGADGSLRLGSGAIAIGQACPADITGDGVVDVDDLVEVILQWGCDRACTADVNDDTSVDIDDLVEVILSWGPCV